MRKVFWSMRSSRPTLSAPSNSFSLSLRLMTTTRSWRLSSVPVQPWPYWNGVSNIGKKSAEVKRTSDLNGFRPLLVGSIATLPPVISAWRLARFSRSRASASNRVFCESGSSPGW
ncbi:hypothetical protein NB713_001018 [Xanthomonas sacchari]|nr:hypothetical protein [Xanthomonas sacchari]